MDYYSDRVRELPRDREEIEDAQWRGICALLKARIADGSFGATYPETCRDRMGAVGTDEDTFAEAMYADIPALGEGRPWYRGEMPTTLDILDMIQFSWRAVGKPVRRDYHQYFKHHHLDYDREAGRAEFRDDINRIFRRNRLAYELTQDGQIERLVPPVLREALFSAEFNSGDHELDQMLEAARRKFLDPDPAVRQEALEKLWDAWERLKTIFPGADKKQQAVEMLDRSAGSSSGKFREMLQGEAAELNKIGNNLQIRHSETTQERLKSAVHVDYLFHRLIAFILMALRADKPV